MDLLFTIGENTIIIEKVRKLISFSDKEFKLKIKDDLYLMTGTNLELLTIEQNAEKLVITGNFTSLSKLTNKVKNKESLLKRLFG